MRCFDTEEGCADGLGNIYNIDFAVPPIRDATLQNILTPLPIVYFVGIVRRIFNRGLKRDYVQQEGDLSRVRGADCRQDAGSGTMKRGPKILYQANVTTGKPDFLYVDEERPLILDTKYKPRYDAGRFDVEDIRQLAGYARDRKALKKLGIQEAEEQSSAVVPCVIIYPEVRGGDVKFDGLRSPIDQVQLEVAPIGAFVGFYRMGFPLPVLSGLDACPRSRGDRFAKLARSAVRA